MFAAGGSAEAAKVGNAESEQFLPPSPLTRPAASALPRYAIWQQGLRFLSTQQAVPGADRVLVPHGSRATGDGQTPPKDLLPPPLPCTHGRFAGWLWWWVSPPAQLCLLQTRGRTAGPCRGGQCRRAVAAAGPGWPGQ